MRIDTVRPSVSSAPILSLNQPAPAARTGEAAPAQSSALRRSLQEDGFTPATLRRGERGPAVESLQKDLVRLGHMTQAQVDTGRGIFGPQTEEAVKSFQRAKGLEADGVVGSNTRGAMGKALAELDRPTTPTTPAPGGTAAPSMEDVAAGKATLQQGMRGPAVEQLQRELVRNGYLTQAQMDTGPGVFGPATKGAVQAFQKDKGLTPPPGLEGAVGKTTWDALRNSRPGNGPGGVPGEPNNRPPSPELAQVRNGQATLGVGARGEAVKALQGELARAGFLSKEGVDGAFGKGTESALTLFQVRNGLTANGRLDQRTLQALERTPTFDTRGSKSETGYQAGRPFPVTLTPIGTEVEGAGRRTAYLRTDAARAFLDMNRAMQRDLGVSLGINDSFRSYADQAARKRQYGRAAAAPGYSNHQQGLSLDLDVRNRRVENWLLNNAHKYGFIRGDNTPDDLVRRLGLAAEGHHYTYRPEFADQAAPRYIQR